MSEDTIRSLSVISKALIKQGFSVMVAGNEPPANLTDHPDFQYLQIPFRIADYEKLDNIESTSIIDESSWMAEVDSTWCLPNLGPEHSAKRIDSCKKHALKALQEVSPKVAFLWSSGVFPSSFIWKQACDSLGIPAFCIERGWLPGTWMLDRGGMQAQSDIVSHPVFRKKSLEHNKSKAAREYINWHQNEYNNYKCNNRDINLLTLGSADFAGVSPRTRPGNILNSPGFTSSEHVASTIESIYPLSGNPKWIYRPHPFHSGDEYPFLKKCHLDIGTDAISLINRSETVVCGLSTLQFQALLCGCSIILTARSPLMGLPGVTEALSPDALAEAIRKPNLKTSLCHKTVLFIDFLLSYACFTVNPTIPGQSADEFFSHIHHLVDKNIDSKDNNSHKIDDLKNLERHAANSLYVILKSDDPVQLIQKIKLENQQLNNQLLAAQSQIEELGAWGNAQNLIITQRDQRIIDLQNEAERFATWARQCDQDVTVARNWAQDNNREVQRLRELLNIAQQRIGELGTWGSNQDQVIAQRDQRIIELQKEVASLGAWGQGLDLALQQQAERIRNLEDSLADQQEVHQQTLEVLLYTQTELQALQARYESEQQARIALEDRVARIWAPIRRWCLPKPR